jgi:F0F1-type ATP synthase epsilon subunit
MAALQSTSGHDGGGQHQQLLVRLLTPNKPPIELNAQSVSLHDSIGQRQILVRHANLAGILDGKPVVVALTDGQIREFLPTGGFYEVSNDTVTLMVTSLQGG